MSSDKQFTATGPAPTGFLASASDIETGADITGNATGGAFHATAQGALVAAVTGDGVYGSGFIAGNASESEREGVNPRGVYGFSNVDQGVGVEGEGQFVGVLGGLLNTPSEWATYGQLGCLDLDGNPTGVFGLSGARGVVGIAKDAANSIGVLGLGNVGVVGESSTGSGVLGVSYASSSPAISAINESGGLGLFVETRGHGEDAATFQGNVSVIGDVTLSGDLEVGGDIFLRNRDVAERFELEAAASGEPGTVMVISENGGIAPCAQAYDTRVVGVVSGAGSLRAAITLGADGSSKPAAAIALMGTANCQVDADRGSIQIGDLLVTSETSGHAMKAADPARRPGAVIGKALASLAAGKGLIPIIVTLQ